MGASEAPTLNVSVVALRTVPDARSSIYRAPLKALFVKLVTVLPAPTFRSRELPEKVLPVMVALAPFSMSIPMAAGSIVLSVTVALALRPLTRIPVPDPPVMTLLPSIVADTAGTGLVKADR